MQNVGVEVDQRTRQYMEQHPEVDYSRAYKIVLDQDPELKRAYAFGPEKDEKHYSIPEGGVTDTKVAVSRIKTIVSDMQSGNISFQTQKERQQELRDLIDGIIKDYSYRHGLEYNAAMARVFEFIPEVKNAYYLS